MELVALHKRVIGLDVHQAQITACAIIEECNRVNEHRWERHRKRLRPRGGWQWVVTDSGTT